MATISFTIQDAQMPRIITAFKSNFGYQEFLPDGTTPNPETGAQFTKRMINEMIKGEVRNYEAGIAARQAAASVSSVDVT
jgi:hypothetical protein